ncbi:MAG: hypothetical protein J0L85_17500 [Zoogloea sp.]|nr:hypothetical protein [Zoogloea sp.]
MVGGFLFALFVADAMVGKPEGGALGRIFWYAVFGSIGGAVVSRWKTQAKVPATRPSSPGEGERSFYDQAISEIEERRAIQGIWAQAFAEAEGDQNRTMARYISLRVAELKAEQQAVPEQATGKVSWWRSALLLIGMFLLAKLIGPAPAVLAVLAYGWMKPRFGVGAAILGSVAVGVSLTVAASMLLQQDAPLSQQDWENGAVSPPSPPLSVDPATAGPAAPQPSTASTNPFTDPNYGLPPQPNKFSFEEAKGEPAPQALAPPAPQPAAPPSDNQLTQAAINETLSRFPYLDGPGSEKWVDAAVAWWGAYKKQGEPNHLAIKHGAEMVDRYRAAGHGACFPMGGRTDQVQCR